MLSFLTDKIIVLESPRKIHIKSNNAHCLLLVKRNNACGQI